MSIKKIGLMDFGTRSKKIDSLSIIESVIDDAVLAEKLGFHRLWYGEHFITSANSPWFSPDMLLPLICGNTNTIRVGVAGVLVGYTSPIRTASSYKMLNNLFNNRIDLGFAKGTPGSNFLPYFSQPKITSYEEGVQNIQNQIAAISSLLNNEDEHVKNGLILSPYKGTIPSLWNLGGSPGSYQASLSNQLNCSRTLFHKGVNLEKGLDNLKAYREDFYKQYGRLPEVNIALAGFTSPSKAKREEVIALSEAEFDFVEPTTRLCCEPQELFDKMSAYAEQYDADEVIFYDIARDPDYRRESMAWISEVFGMQNKQQLVA